jgi:hypothetical protein
VEGRTRICHKLVKSRGKEKTGSAAHRFGVAGNNC